MKFVIIMIYYLFGNIVNIDIIDDDRYVSVLEQIFDGLSHFHAKEMAHRDLKSENLLIEIDPFFKIVIADFGLAKVAVDIALLKTFCGSLKYMAPEVFSGLSSGYGPPVDVWLLGIIVFEWIYSILNSPDISKEVSVQKLYDWIDAWAELLLNKLEDQENDQIIQILIQMIEIKIRKRWSVSQCLMQSFKNGLFKRRMADDLVVCANDPDNLDLFAKEEDDKTKMSTAASVSGSESSQFMASMLSDDDPEAIIILENM